MVLLSILGYKNVQAQYNYSEEQVTKMLKNFYTSYITEYEKPTYNKEKIDSIKSKYCTTELLNYIKKQFQEEKIDYDPYLKAQDLSIETLKTMSFRKDSKRNDLYYVSYIWPYGDKQQVIIKLRIVKEKETYKIGYILIDHLQEETH